MCICILYSNLVRKVKKVFISCREYYIRAIYYKYADSYISTLKYQVISFHYVDRNCAQSYSIG